MELMASPSPSTLTDPEDETNKLKEILGGIGAFAFCLIVVMMIVILVCCVPKHYRRACLCCVCALFARMRHRRRVRDRRPLLSPPPPGAPVQPPQVPRAPVQLQPAPQFIPAQALAPQVPRAPVQPALQVAPAAQAIAPVQVPRAPVQPPQPLPLAPLPAQARNCPQPPAQNIPLVPLQGGADSSSSEDDQPSPQCQQFAADDAKSHDNKQQPDSPCEEQQSLLAASDSPCDEQQCLHAAADKKDEPLVAGSPSKQQSDREKDRPLSPSEDCQHVQSLPSFSAYEKKPRTARRATSSIQLGVDEERRILLEDQDEQPVSDRPAASSTDETGRHMKRQYGTSSLHSASETSPMSKSPTSSNKAEFSDENKEDAG